MYRQILTQNKKILLSPPFEIIKEDSKIFAVSKEVKVLLGEYLEEQVDDIMNEIGYFGMVTKPELYNYPSYTSYDGIKYFFIYYAIKTLKR